MKAFASTDRDAVKGTGKPFARVGDEHFSPVFMAEASGKVIHRKASCACGGGCPTCEAKSSDLNISSNISSPDDAAEIEADRIADRVIRMPVPPSPAATILPHIQRSPVPSADGAGAIPASVEGVISGPGQPMEPVLRHDMERRFGNDFSSVRIYSGPAAEHSARDIDANAYTVGNNIVFGAGQFAAGTFEGRRLLAHELTHVVQQKDHFSNVPVGRQILRDKKKAESPGNREAFLKRLGMWPNEAHAYWKRLSDGEKIAVRMMMGERYGQDFASEFVKFTKSGATSDSSHYGPGFPEHTPKWFKERGFRLAHRDSLNDWWVHPSGYSVTADRDIPWGKTGERAPSQPASPANTPVNDSKEMLSLSLDAIRGDLEEARNRQAELIGQKTEMDGMNFTTDAFKTAYDAYVAGLNEGKKRLREQLDSIADMETSLGEMGADVSAIRTARDDLEDISIWFDVSSDWLKMEGRSPINAQFR